MARVKVSSFDCVPSPWEIFSRSFYLKMASTAMMFKFLPGLHFLGPPHLGGTGLPFPQLSCSPEVIHRLKLLHFREDRLPH